MMHQQISFKIFLFIIILLWENINCNDNRIQSKLRFKRNYKREYVRQYDMNHLPTNASYYKNKLDLPEKAIYCTIIPTENTDRFSFLWKYYSSIAVKPDQYTNSIECIYPRSVEFPNLGDEIPTTPKPKQTPIEKFQEALIEHTSNFREFLDKIDRGENPEPMKPFDTKHFADEIVNDIFHHKPDPIDDTVDATSPNGIICERIKFIESDKQNLEIIRPICYPASRPPPPPTTTTTPQPTTTTASSDIYDKACYVLCHTGAIYQLLPCCRK